MDTLLIFFLNRSFMDIVEKDKNRVFSKFRESSPFCILSYMARKISNLSASYTRLWLVEFLHFSRYKYRIKLVSILRQREDQALISISTILKFSALYPNRFFWPVWIRFTCFYFFKLLIFICFFFAKVKIEFLTG